MKNDKTSTDHMKYTLKWKANDETHIHTICNLNAVIFGYLIRKKATNN